MWTSLWTDLPQPETCRRERESHAIAFSTLALQSQTVLPLYLQYAAHNLSVTDASPRSDSESLSVRRWRCAPGRASEARHRSQDTAELTWSSPRHVRTHDTLLRSSLSMKYAQYQHRVDCRVYKQGMRPTSPFWQNHQSPPFICIQHANRWQP